MLAIFKREFKAYFLSPFGYVFLGLFLLVSGIFFAFGNVLNQNSSFPNLLTSIQFVFIFAVPALTMRLLSEEMRQKTDQLLLTSPVSITSIVVGKYLASFCVFFIAIAFSLFYMLAIKVWGYLDVAQSFGALIGFVLAGGAYIAIGILISTVTENQTVSAIATFIVLLLLQLITPIRSALPQTFTSGIILAAILIIFLVWLIYSSTKNISVSALAGVAVTIVGILVLLFKKDFYTSLVSDVIGLFAIAGRQQRMNEGILAIDDSVYYLSFIFVMLFITVRMIEKRRWS